MAIPKSWSDRLGSWKGTYKLRQSWLAPDKQIQESASALHLDSDARRTYATIVYHWTADGVAQEGTMLITYASKAKRLEIGWADSWHQSTAIFHAKGEEAADGSFLCKGSYTAGGQTWGWTISIAFVGEELRIKMDNVPPDGKPDWAVDSVYRRA